MLDGHLLDLTVSYWNAANYLTVAQIYLQENPLLQQQLTPQQIKPRLLGHWGTSPGLNLIYTQLNYLINQTGANVIYVTGPGHGGPALIANVYLEGTYSDIYPETGKGIEGLTKLVRQFSTPGGVPSHVGASTPGSIHEGGELGYSLAHAFGAAFDNPNLIVACVIGDGEAETGPLAASWKSVEFLNPSRDGAVLPIFHLNGYKISGPTVFGRMQDGDLGSFLNSQGYEAHFVEGNDPHHVHKSFSDVLMKCHHKIRNIQGQSQTHTATPPNYWPAIVLRTPKGWTGPSVVDGQQVEGTFRAHQVPLSQVRENSIHLKLLERWMRSYKPEQLFDHEGYLINELAQLAPIGEKRMGSQPYANGGKIRVPLRLPSYDNYAIDIKTPGNKLIESTRVLGELLRDVFEYNANDANFRLFCPDETNSNRLTAVFEVENRMTMQKALVTDDNESSTGRIMEVLSEHLCEGWLEGYLLSGRHGLFATYEAFAMISASMTVQHAKWLEETAKLDWRIPISSLNILLTSTCWRNDHNGFSHQGPGLIDVAISMRGTIARVYLPPDANCLLVTADHCLRSANYVNLIVIDKQPQLQYLDIDTAREHCRVGAGIWKWASHNDTDDQPDFVLACAGDIMTMETLAAAQLLREELPDVKLRFVNVVDLMALFSGEEHPHGMSPSTFASLFTDDAEVIFAFHGYAQVLHQLLHGRPNAGRFHVRGFIEEGTTTTPFDMVVLNQVSRYHLVLEALRRSKRTLNGSEELIKYCHQMLNQHNQYVREHLEDLPEITQWRWATAT